MCVRVPFVFGALGGFLGGFAIKEAFDQAESHIHAGGNAGGGKALPRLDPARLGYLGYGRTLAGGPSVSAFVGGGRFGVQETGAGE